MKDTKYNHLIEMSEDAKAWKKSYEDHQKEYDRGIIIQVVAVGSIFLGAAATLAYLFFI